MQLLGPMRGDSTSAPESCLPSPGASLQGKRIAKTSDLTPERARVQLEQEEDARREFHRHHFRVDPDDANAYDLIVNTGTLGMDVAIGLVVEAMSRRFAAGR